MVQVVAIRDGRRRKLENNTKRPQQFFIKKIRGVTFDQILVLVASSRVVRIFFDT